jgi:hypothetical protein
MRADPIDDQRADRNSTRFFQIRVAPAAFLRRVEP